MDTNRGFIKHTTMGYASPKKEKLKKEKSKKTKSIRIDALSLKRKTTAGSRSSSPE
jgi:hypothetical protein